jgi:ABC-type antimicrobial peptide transport system permease subunit
LRVIKTMAHSRSAPAMTWANSQFRYSRSFKVWIVTCPSRMCWRWINFQSFDATLITSFAVLSLLLAAAGLFGVLSYIVAQRSGEIGIRIALGAQREQVLKVMLVDGLRPALIGLLLGLAASAATTQFIKSMLYETQPLDPGVFAAVAAC